MKEIDI